MKREGLWLGAIIILVALSVIGVVKLPTHYGLDIKGGARAVLQAVPSNGQTLTPETHQILLETITRRVNATGVAEPSIQPKGNDQFIVELPNVTNKDDLIKEIGTTAQMEFRYFQQVRSKANPGARYTMNVDHVAGMEVYSFRDSATNTSFRDQSQIEGDFDKLMAQSQERSGATIYSLPPSLKALAPNDRSLYFTPEQAKQADTLGLELQAFTDFLATCPVEITGSDLTSDSAAHLDPTKGAVVTFSMKPSGADKFGDFTAAHTNEIMAILLDNRIITAPNIEEPIRNGETEISGGFKNLNEAVTLANLINAGALPVPLKIVENESIEATLGQTALRHMIVAGLVGMACVLVFMLLYYLLPGLVANVALLFYILFTIGVFKGDLGWFIPPVTLTLPGIAGFILSVGMAVDANILIFERLKEELRNGKPLRQAIDAGFKRAFSAIRDSNICTIITCTILFLMGSPTVKGFALTLGIGVVISLFTAITVTRTLLYLLVDAGMDKHPSWFGLGRQWFGGSRFREGSNVAPDPSKQLHVIRNRNWFYGLSALIIVPGIVFWFMGGLKRSIEFTGGTQVEVVFDQPISQHKVSAALEAAGLKDNLVQMANGGSVAYISIKSAAAPSAHASALPIPAALMGRANAAMSTSATSAAPATSATSATSATAPAMPVSTVGTNPENGEANDYLKIAFLTGPGAPAPASSPVTHPALDSLGVKYHLESHSLVGGVISKELTNNAFQAVIVASILIVLYLSFAFSIGGFVAGLRFGTSAIIALLHDVLVLIGSFAFLGYMFNWEIDSLFITATLTVVGFSVHDTIVIFDRLRENLRHRIRGESFEDLANRSIIQSFARSINTSFTVILTLLAMLFLGEPSTRLLVAALLIGIVSGTYSSIFNATPILVDWENYLANKKPGASEHIPPPTPSSKPAPVKPVAPAIPDDPSSSGGRSAKPRRGGASRRF